jgi:hypothetical protein
MGNCRSPWLFQWMIYCSSMAWMIWGGPPWLWKPLHLLVFEKSFPVRFGHIFTTICDLARGPRGPSPYASKKMFLFSRQIWSRLVFLLYILLHSPWNRLELILMVNSHHETKRCTPLFRTQNMNSREFLAYLGTWNNHNSEMFRASEFPWDFGAKSPQKDGSKFGEEYWGGWSMRTPSRAAQKLPGGSNK